MIKIHQALFGYSNGHHILSCSRQLSSHSLKILEPLSDLSGYEMQPGFEEYITGAPLVEDKCYAISTTWYASEMKRPGCVWTHTLFIDFSDLPLLTMNNTINDLFIRPSKMSGPRIEEYSKPIYVEKINNDNINYHLSKKQLNDIGYILRPLLEYDKPIIINSEQSLRYNEMIEYLWLRLSNNFFGKISFCTGSLSNRMIEKKPLDIQIVPSSLLKNITRSVKNIQIIPENHNNGIMPQWLVLFIREFVHQENCGFRYFISIFSEKYLDRQYYKVFAELYMMIHNKNSFDTVCFFDIIFKSFEGEERLYVNNKALSFLLMQNDNEFFFMTKPSIILKELSISERKDIIEEFDVSNISCVIGELWNIDSMQLKDVFSFLINNEINSFGENLIVVLASIVKPERLSELTGDGFEGSNMLISINSQLALCEELWHKPKNFQMETLNSLKKSIGKSSDDLVKSINFVIYNSSVEDIERQLYDTFGDISIETFFSWASNINDLPILSRWSNLCKYNVTISIKNLPYIQNLNLLQIVINNLNPYVSEVLSVDKTIWVNIYHRFCNNGIDSTFNNTFAQFLLPIIIQTKEKYPTDIAYFAFNKVHDLLALNEIDYITWCRLSNLLPEVSWYNNWDKCKRLRKVAKKMIYNFKLK